jgi:hypothetical protein
VDQREWDYGARLPRDRPVPESWSTQNGPESTETPQWGSVTDTGSLVPSPEAIAWAQRADAWAQQPPAEQAGQVAQWEPPVSRWSEVEPTGRPGLPAEGVGWRTETAEWRAAEQTARWRQTTEWRSASGTHGWRSTTEAWQTGSGAEGFLPPADPSTRQQLAISGTAWPTPQDSDQAGGTPADAPSWQQTPDRTIRSDGTSWQGFTETTPPRAEPVDGRPSWQQFAAPPPAPWQQQTTSPGPASWEQTTASGPAPWEQTAPWEQPTGTPPWEQAAPAGTPPWQAAQTGAPPREQRPWQGFVDSTPSRQQPDPAPAETNSYNGSWSGAVDDGRHLVREDDRAQWRRESAAGMTGADGPRPPGRRRAPEAGGSKNTGGGTGWSGRSDTDNWAGHTDTGSMPMFQPPPVVDVPAWDARPDAPSWRDNTEVGTWSDRVGTPERQREIERPSWQSDGTGRVRDDETPSWQRGSETSGRRRDPNLPGWQPSAPPDTETPSWRRGADRPLEIESGSWQGAGTRTPEPEIPSWQRDRVARPENGVPSWQTRPDADAPGRPGEGESRRRGNDLSSWRRDADRPREIEASPSRRRDPDDETPSWRRDLADETSDWRTGRAASEAPTWRGDRADGDRADGYRADGATPSRRRDEPATDWRDRSDSWRTEPDSGSWSRGDEPRSDGWRRSAGPDPEDDGPGWRDGGPDTGSWRREPDPASDPWGQSAADTGVIPATWQQPVSDTSSWRSGPDGGRPYGGARRRAADDERAFDEGPGTTGRRRAIESGSRSAPPTDDRRPDDFDTDRRRPPAEYGGRPDDFEPGRRRPPSENGRRPDDFETDGRRPPAGNGRRPAPMDAAAISPEVWSSDSRPRRGGANWPADELPSDEPPAAPLSPAEAHPDWRRELREEVRRENPGDAVTEIRPRPDPGAWQSEERREAAQGTATYREGHTGDWRRDLAADSDLADGESRRFGTQDFVPFRPVGSAAVAAPPASAPPLNGAAAGPREELLVGNERPATRWQDPPDTQWPPRGAGDYQDGTIGGYQGGTAGGSYERRSVSSLPGPSGRQSNLLEPEDDEIEESTGGPLAAVGYTVIWYGVPVVLFVLYMLVLNGKQQAHALSTLAGAAPQFALSLVLSMLVAVGLRWASGSWKAASVGLAAAVMGGGLATVLSSAITGNALN